MTTEFFVLREKAKLSIVDQCKASLSLSYNIGFHHCLATNLKPITLDCNTVVRIAIDKEMCCFNMLSNADEVLFVAVVPNRKCDSEAQAE